MAERKHIMVVPFGEWKGHDAGEQSYGPEEAEKIVARANALVESSGNPIQIDYEHSSLNPPADGAPAAGWMYSFTVENDGVYAEVEWTPKAKEFIDNGEYKYISPVIATGLADPVTGIPAEIELFNAALTNQPFMHDRMKQVVASAIAAKGEGQWYTNAKQITISNNKGGTMAPEEIVPAIAGAIGLPATATIDEIEGVIKAVKQYLATMPGAPEGGGMPTPDQMGEMELEMKKQAAYSKIATDLAAELNTEPDKLIPTVKAMSMTKNEDTKTAERIAALEAELKARKIADLITANSNRIPPAERENVRAFANKYGIEAATEMVAKLPELPNSGAGKRVDNSRETIEAERLAIAKAQGISTETIQKYSRNINKEA